MQIDLGSLGCQEHADDRHKEHRDRVHGDGDRSVEAVQQGHRYRLEDGLVTRMDVL